MLRAVLGTSARSWGRLLVALCAGSAAMVCAQQERPRALERAAQARQGIVTARLDWAGERQRAGERRLHRTTRIGGNSALTTVHGDDDGVVVVRHDGAPSPLNQNPYCYLIDDGQTWEYQQESVEAELQPKALHAYCPDLRSAGFSPFPDWRSVDEVVWTDKPNAPPTEWEERVEDGLHVVIAKRVLGVFTWWIDPERGWQPVRTTFADQEGIAWESRSELEQVDGVWFPRSVVFLERAQEGGLRLAETVAVERCLLNDPSLPLRLTPKDLGLDAGFNILAYDEAGEERSLKFDGEKAVSLEEYAERFKKGEIKKGPRFARLMAGLRQDAAIRKQRGVERPPGARIAPDDYEALTTPENYRSLWQLYTLSFIRKHKLDADQVQKAWITHDDCVQRAQRLAAAADRRLAAARDPNGETPQRAAVEIYAKLVDDICDVFYAQLKPRLEQTLTREQKQQNEAP